MTDFEKQLALNADDVRVRMQACDESMQEAKKALVKERLLAACESPWIADKRVAAILKVLVREAL